MSAAKTTIIGVLIAVITAFMITVTLPGQVQNKIYPDHSEFYVYEDGQYVIGGVEWILLLNETNVILPVNATVKSTKSGLKFTVTSTINYPEDRKAVHVHVFNGSTSEVTKFPVDEKVTFTNAKGLKWQYLVTNLTGITNNQSVTSPAGFGRRMRITWQDGYEWAQTAMPDRLAIQYNLTKKTQAFNVRLFDPDSCGRVTASKTLTSDVSTDDTACFSIEGSNLTLDCAGFKITFDNTTAINVTNQRNVTIQNCNITDTTLPASSPVSIGLNFTNTTGIIKNNIIIAGTSASPRALVLDVTNLNVVGFLFNISIFNNTFNGTATSSGSRALLTYGTTTPGNIFANISNNIFTVFGTTGVAAVGGVSNALQQQGIVFNNNFLYSVGTVTPYGIGVRTRDWNISNNNIFVTGTTTVQGISINTDAVTDYIYGNNITVTGTTTGPTGIDLTGGTANSKNPIIFENNSLKITSTTSTTAIGVAMAIASNNTVFNRNNFTFLQVGVPASTIYSITAIVNISSSNNVFTTSGSSWFRSITGGVRNTLSFTNDTLSNSNGSITFTPTITVFKSIYDFNSTMYNISFNRTFVNSTNLSEFNNQSLVVLTGLPSEWTNATPVIDKSDTNTFTNCSAANCTFISFDGSTLVFNVSGWTQYAAQNASDPPPPPPDVIPPNVSLLAPLNASFVQGPIVGFIWKSIDNAGAGSNCTVTIQGLETNISITTPDNTATGINYSFASTGLKYWNVSCTDTSGNLNTSLTSNFTVTNGIPLTNCTTLSTSGNYEVAKSLVNNTPSCFNITANDVVLDCNGFNITGNRSTSTGSMGINSSSRNNVTIRNCIVTNWTDGIFIARNRNNTIFNNTLLNNSDDGLDFSNGNYSVISFNNATDNFDNGIELNGWWDNITNNTIVNSRGAATARGIEILSISTNLTISNNTIFNTQDEGLRIDSSDNMTIFGNTIFANGAYGMELVSSQRNVIYGNLIRNNSDYGMRLNTVSYSLINANNVSLNQRNNIIAVNNSAWNNYTNNIVTRAVIGVGSGFANGISLSNSTNTLVRNNTAFNNSDDGIHLGQSNNTIIVGNIVWGNGDDGIDPSFDDGDNITNNTIYLNRFGIALTPANNTRITNNVIYNSSGSVDGSGIHLTRGSTNVTIDANLLFSFHSSEGRGVNFFGNASILQKNIWVTNNIINDTGDQGISLYNVTENVFISNNTFNNNGINDSASEAIYVRDANNVTITGNTFTNPGPGGVVVDYGQNITIIKNTFLNASGPYVLFNRTNQTYITNNTVDPNGQIGLKLISANDVFILNQTLANYSFNSSGFLYGNLFGTVKWNNRTITQNGTNFSAAVQLTNAQIIVNSTKDQGLNQSANISFGSFSGSNPQIRYSALDNGAFITCPANQCTQISYAGTVYTFNVTKFTTYTVLATAPPGWFFNVSFPSSPVIYSPTATYQFNVTWNSTDTINQVFMKDNFTGVNVSTQLFNYSGSQVYNRTIGPLPAGGFTWSQNATDSFGSVNETPTFHFDVQQAVPNITLTLNNNPSQYNVSTTATCTVNASQLSVSLYRNNTLVSNPETVKLAAGTWTYNCNTTGNRNYTTPANVSTVLTVNQAAGKMNLTLNLTSQDWTIGVGSSLDLLAQKINGTGGFDLLLNGTAIASNVASSVFTIQNFSSPGVFNVTARLNATENFTYNISSFLVTVTNTQPTVNLNTPANNTQFNDTSLNLFNWTAIDDFNATTFCNLTINSTVYPGNTTLNNTPTYLAASIPFGRSTWSVSCTDGYASNVSTPRFVYFNSTRAPGVQLVSPSNGSSFVGINNVTLSWNATDAASLTFNCTVMLNGTVIGDNVTTNNTVMNRNAGGLGNGARTWQVNCTNGIGFKNSSSIFTFSIGVAPTINLSVGIPNATFRPNMTTATYALVFNSSGSAIGLTNLTSYNNSIINQSPERPVFNISMINVSSPFNITINATFNSSFGVRCGNSSNLSRSIVMSNLSTISVLRCPVAGVCGIWCWGDYKNASSGASYSPFLRVGSFAS